MRISFAHIREKAAAGGFVDFAVFDARSASGAETDNAALLLQLTVAARAQGLKVDQSALAYMNAGRIQFYGTDTLVSHLAKSGLPTWTHWIDML